MSMNLSSKLDELQSDRHFETTVALSEIRTQLQELTKSVESCHNEIGIVKTDMVAIKHELDAVQQVKEEIEELREYVDRLEEQSHRRKALLLRQVRKPQPSVKPGKLQPERVCFQCLFCSFYLLLLTSPL
jgi:MFS transporter, SP family, solute carrier family 2 (facilitated glucose transporter), member 1